jgi:3(or 17)beta-hydroxysteroid dehydrogenase
MGRVSGKIALVTGAASGLGEADARRLAEEGATVILTDINATLGREVAGSIPGAIFIEHDVRDEGQWQALIRTAVERCGGLHILVNNAGVVRVGNIEECTLADIRLQLQIMVEGTLLGCKYAIPAIAAAGGGAIVNIASIAAFRSPGNIPAYAAAKAGVIALTHSVSTHCHERGYGIRVNAIAPGAHNTPMVSSSIAAMPPAEAAIARANAMGSGQPQDVANLVLFLASDEARHINGTVMVIDNGELVR